MISESTLESQTTNAWVNHAEALAEWVKAHLVVRDDAFVQHYLADGQIKKRWVDQHLSLERIAAHFRTVDQSEISSGPLISLACLGTNGEAAGAVSRFVVIDIDHHTKRTEASTHRAATTWQAPQGSRLVVAPGGFLARKLSPLGSLPGAGRSESGPGIWSLAGYGLGES